MKPNVIVIGAGIVGLGMARALSIKGASVTVVERNSYAIGASIRNFGMVWPIGQPDGGLYERAILTKHIWKEICSESGIWYDPVGSLHLAYSELEVQVLEDFYSTIRESRKCTMLNSSSALRLSSAIVSSGLRAALFSPDEMILDSPKAIRTLPSFLEEKYGVQFLWDSHVNHIETGKVHIGKQVLACDQIYVCTGPDFENLFPDDYKSLPITKCKLQMMRMGVQPDNWRLGPSLCGGLSLTHYSSFKTAGESLANLKRYFQDELPEHVKWGIHVMVSQNSSGELIIGDSHEYGLTHDPFDKGFVNEYILAYLKTFARFQNEQITYQWNGTYTKMTDGSTELIFQPLPGVTVVNGLGGAGMTLALGLTHQLVFDQQ